MGKGAFDQLGDVLGGGFDLSITEDADFSHLPLDQIVVLESQVREEFSDDENSLDELAESIKAKGVLQPILVRPVDGRYELVAGERRFRASKQAGLDSIPAFIKTLSDDEAKDAQLQENIQRKNLTQLEVANRLKADLDELGGNIEALMEKHNKSRAWISKQLGLLKAGPEARRLMTDNISADVEVINTVRQIEEKDPEQAKAVVKQLEEGRGTVNARSLVSKEKKKDKKGKTGKKVAPKLLSAREAIKIIYIEYINKDTDLDTLSMMLDADAQALAVAWLRERAEEGLQCKKQGDSHSLASEIMGQQRKNPLFGGDPVGLMALCAFLLGYENASTLFTHKTIDELELSDFLTNMKP